MAADTPAGTKKIRQGLYFGALSNRVSRGISCKGRKSSDEFQNWSERLAVLERKVVTILFTDLVGSTRLASELDPEEMRDLMARYRDAISTEVGRYGGTMEKFIGDAPVVVFGVPQTHEDDPVRALRVAFAIREAVKRIDPGRLDVRTGIYTGEVVADPTAAQRGEFMVSGEAVHLSQRLQAAAEPGEILVGLRTWKDTKAVADFEAVEPLTLKGTPSAVPAFRALRLLERPPQLSGTVGFVGRSYELALLELLFDRVCAERRPHLVTLLGPPGIGKTSLADEFCRRTRTRAPQLIVRQGTCKPYDEAWLYCPIGAVMGAELPDEIYQIRDLGPLIERIAETFRHVCTECGAPVGPIERLARVYAWCSRHDCSLDPPPSRRELFHAWRFLLEVRALHTPVVVTFDNVQWSSDEPLDFIESLPSTLTDLPVLIIAIARPELLERRPRWGGGGGNTTTVQLGPLTGDQTQTLVTQILDGPIDPGVTGAIEERTEGNPYFVIELIRMVVEDDVLVRRDGRWQFQAAPEALTLPDTVHAVVAARIDRLPPLEKRTLLLASYAAYSRYFWDQPLRRTGDLVDADIDSALEGLVAKGLVTEVSPATATPILGFDSLENTRQFTFSHAFIREVAREMVPKADRPRLHLAFADWLEEVMTTLPWGRKTMVQTLAPNLFEAWHLLHERRRDDPSLAERAIRACLAAAEAQRGCGATREALENLRRALQMTRASVPQREPEIATLVRELEQTPTQDI